MNLGKDLNENKLLESYPEVLDILKTTIFWLGKLQVDMAVLWNQELKKEKRTTKKK